MDTKAGLDPILTRAGVERTGAMYLAGQDPRQPLLSPAVVADLTGFPPMLLQAGTNDITAGVPHVFQSFAGGPLDEADQALDRAALFISQHIPSGTATAPARAN